MIRWAFTVVIGFTSVFILAILGTPVWLTFILLVIFFDIEMVNNK